MAQNGWKRFEMGWPYYSFWELRSIVDQIEGLGMGDFQLGPAKQGLLVWSGQLLVKLCLLK